MVGWSNKTFYINETTQITMGKLVFVILITLFQFFGMWCENTWVLTGSMFFLFANAFFTLSKSTKAEDMLALESLEVIKNNKAVICDLRRDILELKNKIEKISE